MYFKILYIILAILLISMVYQGYTNVEGLTNYANLKNPSKDILLSCSYPLQKNIGISTINYSDAYKKKNFIPMSSYTQETNNMRYLKTPDNESCHLIDLCHGIYKNKEIENIPLQAPNEQDIRVNFYNQLN